jgi:hypothetical protein
VKDFQKLKEHIKKYITLGETLRTEGRIALDMEEEQIHCPFHGPDNKKSARYYRETDTVYCWVCRKVWDIFSYTQQTKGLTYGQAIKELVNVNRIDVSSVPDQIESFVKGITGAQASVIIDRKKLFLMQVHDYIYKMRDKIELDKYKKLVHSYIIIKYMVSDEKFMEVSAKMNEALIRITKT